MRYNLQISCSEAKLTAQIKHEMHIHGLVTMYIGGGMGAASVFENLQYEAA